MVWYQMSSMLVQVYVDDIIFGSTKKSLCTEFKKMMHKKFQMSSMLELTFLLGLQVKQKEDGIFISQDKYVTEILKKFVFSDVKTVNIPMETHKPFLKDADGEDVDEHLYRSMIGSLMYLTSSRPDIMFAVCACARFQVNPKVSHLHAVKRIFRYLKGASLDRKSTTGGCQFLGCRLISWQCKKQTVVANSTTKAEYIAASNYCGQVLWIQNQMLDYGYNFMHTKIYIDNESTICIVKNLVFHSKTKHIEIRHHFIKDSNEKKLIHMIKIHIDQNVVDLLTKAFDRIIHKGWLEWKAKAAKDGIEVKTGNSRVNAVGHYLVLLSENSHNMVAYLEKSTENADFAKIVDFLNANLIRYALTVSPTIYVSCIEQFWSTSKIKTVNNEIQIHAKVEGKTIVISESSVRRDLQFDDEDGIACLINNEIFENLQLMGYENLSDKLTFYKSYFSPQWKYLIHTILQCLSSKSTAWNEFGTNIASAVICLATNQKFKFSKLIFDSMLRNLDSSNKFLMYPRFLQVFLNKKIENLSDVNVVYDTPSHTKKVFANIRRKGKEFSGKVTPLFETMLIQQQAKVGEGSGHPTDPQHTSITASPSQIEPITIRLSLRSGKTEWKRAATTASSLEAEQDSGNINRTQSIATLNEPSPQGTGLGSGPRCQDTILGDAEAQTRFETASKQSNDPPLSRVNTLRSGEDRLKLKELMDLCTKLSDSVLDLETTKTAQAKEIASLKKRVKKLERKRKSKTPGMNLFNIGTSSRRSLGEENASKQGKNLKQRKQSSIFEESDFDDEGFAADMDEVFKDVEGDAEQVISAAADEVSTGDAVNTASTEVNTASALVTTAGVSVSTAEPITTASVNITTAKPTTPPTTTTTAFEDEDLTIAQTLVKMRSEKSKVRGVIMQEPSETTTRPTVPPQQHDPKDKGKGKMVEQEKPLKKKDQIKFDEEIAQRLQAHMQAELEEEERVARERKEDANIAE
ncbi:putative ribonuclease H-like domain-containing protein [Tanacetum coccineum]